MTLLEDSIIAYFDNRLSAAERADLLRQVSADAEHRKLFQQHEAMRSRIYRAQVNVSVAPVVEEKLLASIAAMQPSTAPFIAKPIHVPLGAFAFAVVAIVSTLYLTAPLFRTSTATRSLASLNRASSAGSADQKPQALVTQPSEMIMERPVTSAITATVRNSDGSLSASRSNAPITEVPKKSEFLSNILPKSEEINSVGKFGDVRPYAVPVKGELTDGAPALRAMDAMLDRSSATPKCEITLLGMNGGGSPNGMHHLWDFGGAGIAAAYYLDASDLVGIRASGGRVKVGENLTPLSLRPDSASFATRYTAELFVEHRELVLNGRLILTGAIGAGLMQQGNLFSAELGFRIPVTSRLQAGVTYSLSRTHWTADLQYFDPNDKKIETHGPNSINSRLLYGLSYTF